jgi:hypothetical protein
MRTTKHFIVMLLCVLLSAPATLAQNPQRNGQTGNAVSQDVLIIIQQQQVRFTAQKPVQEMQLQVFNQAGELVHDSGASYGPEINWPLQSADGQPLKSGLYAYTLSLKEQGAEAARIRRGHFIVDRAQDRDGADKLWVTSQNSSGVGTELTVARDENAVVAGAITSGERTLEARGESQKRESGDRSVEAEAQNQTLAAKTTTAAIAAGTAGRIAKFTSGTDLGNSVMTELNGNVGIGTTNPSARLEVVHPATQVRFGSSAADNGGYLISVFPSQAILSGGGSWNGANWIAKDRVASATAHQHGVIQFFTNGNLAVGSPFGPLERMRVDANGNVGIGTQTPSLLLDVAGQLRAVRNISNDIVVETTGGTNAWAKLWMKTPSQQWNIGTSQNYNGNQFSLHDATFNQIRMMVQPNGGEIAFPNAVSNHLVVRTSGGTNAWAQFRVETPSQRWVMGTSQNYNGNQFYLTDDTRNQPRLTIQPNGGSITFPLGDVGIGTTDPRAKLDVAGRTRTGSLEITGGADFAENFDVSSAATGSEAAPAKVDAGMVVSIDPTNPGKLQLSTQAYDYQVAGIISGAGGVKPGMMMSQEGTLADGKHPVALSGRVYCWTDASNGPIKPGDLLTTSDTPGHAMKVTDRAKAQGAIIGKAMTGLKEGKGLVLVLVTLQ